MELLLQIRALLLVLGILSVGGLLFGLYVGIVFLIDAVKRGK